MFHEIHEIFGTPFELVFGWGAQSVDFSILLGTCCTEGTLADTWSVVDTVRKVGES